MLSCERQATQQRFIKVSCESREQLISVVRAMIIVITTCDNIAYNSDESTLMTYHVT